MTTKEDEEAEIKRVALIASDSRLMAKPSPKGVAWQGGPCWNCLHTLHSACRGQGCTCDNAWHKLHPVTYPQIGRLKA
jgi:hypothetical protein